MYVVICCSVLLVRYCVIYVRAFVMSALRNDCALSVCVLFAILWYNYVLNWFPWGYIMPFIFGSIVFLLVGLCMMISCVEKEDHNK